MREHITCIEKSGKESGTIRLSINQKKIEELNIQSKQLKELNDDFIAVYEILSFLEPIKGILISLFVVTTVVSSEILYSLWHPDNPVSTTVMCASMAIPAITYNIGVGIASQAENISQNYAERRLINKLSK